jgi:hypothetical protein
MGYFHDFIDAAGNGFGETNVPEIRSRIAPLPPQTNARAAKDASQRRAASATTKQSS